MQVIIFYIFILSNVIDIDNNNIFKKNVDDTVSAPARR